MKPNLLDLIEEIKKTKNTDEYCLFITSNIEDFENNKKNVKATKYFAEIDENIVTRVVNYDLYKEDVDKYFEIKYLPKLLYIKGNEILADLPVYNYSILNGIE